MIGVDNARRCWRGPLRSRPGVTRRSNGSVPTCARWRSKCLDRGAELHLRFLPPADRLALLSRIRAVSRRVASLILSEKIAGADAAADALLIEMHHAFKRANGYSDLEISRKRTALENVLVPGDPCRPTRRACSRPVSCAPTCGFQCFNFISLVAHS